MLRKILLSILVLVLIVAGAIALFIKYGADGTIREAIERHGSALAETPVQVDNVGLSLFGGSIDLDGIAVRNPEGFSDSNALSLGKVRVAVDRGSLFSDEIVINEIVFENPSVLLERAKGTNNLEAIKAAIDRNRPPVDESGEPVRMLIKVLDVRGTKLQYSLREGAAPKTMELPDIRLENIGTGGAGQDIKSVVNQVVARMTPVVIAELAKLEGVQALRDIVGGSVNVEGLMKDLPVDVKDLDKGLGKVFDKFK